MSSWIGVPVVPASARTSCGGVGAAKGLGEDVPPREPELAGYHLEDNAGRSGIKDPFGEFGGECRQGGRTRTVGLRKSDKATLAWGGGRVEYAGWN